MMFLYDRAPHRMVVRYSGNPAQVRAGRRAGVEADAPDVPFEAEFSEEIVAELYERRRRRGRRPSPASPCSR